VTEADAEEVTVREQSILSSPLKWAGGKSWALSRLLEIYQPHRHRRLVEPFVGGMNVALGLRPERALLSDVNPHLINFYAHLDEKPFELKMENSEELFYAYRQCFNELIATNARYTRTAAELFYYLNRTCFNGLCRFSTKKGEFNTPFGTYATINYRRDFSVYGRILRTWKIMQGDFLDTAWFTNDDDFVFLDPPYDGTFTDYSAGGFSWDDQVALVKAFAAHSGPVVATNAATERVLDLYRSNSYTVETLEAPRRISSDGDRTPALEMLATKNCS
jgi:DNA adenine methylase